MYIGFMLFLWAYYGQLLLCSGCKPIFYHRLKA
ncbi:hypothetical protein [Ghiorsea bivora]